MRKFVPAILSILGLGAAAFAVFLAFSFSQNYVTSLAGGASRAAKITGDLSQKTWLPLNAEALFGSNLMNLAASVFTDSMLAQNLNGPKQVASGSLELNVDAKQTGMQIYSAAMNQVLSEMPLFTGAEINVVPDTQQSINAYAQDFISGVNQYMKQFRGKDILQLAYQMNSQNDADARRTLVAYADASGHMIDYLKTLSVPQSWATIQVLYMNVLSQARYTALAFLTQQNDPLRANIMTRNYPSLLAQYAQFEQMFGPQLQKAGYAI